jgi:lipopolysaccharide/colanic/teichoic acid biosynthesis glycosyltransferase
LPALWNIVKGDMSLVGPRPLHPHYDALYSPRQKRRLDVRPGVTGWAQVNGRNAISWPAKFEFDAWYVENQSLLLDLKILLATIPDVLSRRGINAADAATMPAFAGETALEKTVTDR